MGSRLAEKAKKLAEKAEKVAEKAEKLAEKAEKLPHQALARHPSLSMVVLRAVLACSLLLEAMAQAPQLLKKRGQTQLLLLVFDVDLVFLMFPPRPSAPR